MILVDTAVWVDHLARGDRLLASQLEVGRVLGHPWVVGEVSLGDLRDRTGVLGLLRALPSALVASDEEILAVVERYRLPGRGIGYVDAGLLASTLLTPDAELWTRDRRLREAADVVGVSHAAA